MNSKHIAKVIIQPMYSFFFEPCTSEALMTCQDGWQIVVIDQRHPETVVNMC